MTDKPLSDEELDEIYRRMIDLFIASREKEHLYPDEKKNRILPAPISAFPAK